MTEDFKDKIEHHINKHENIAEKVENQEVEIKAIKKTALSFGFFAFTTFIGCAIGYGIWIGNIQSNMAENRRDIEKIEVAIVAIDKRQQNSDLIVTEVKTKLTGIEASLLEIKEALRIRK